MQHPALAQVPVSGGDTGLVIKLVEGTISSLSKIEMGSDRCCLSSKSFYPHLSIIDGFTDLKYIISVFLMIV